MHVIAFNPREHLERLVIQPMQAGTVLAPAEGEALAAAGPSYSAVGDDGTVYAICGLQEQWSGRAIAWGMIALDAGRHFVRIDRAVRRFFMLDTHRRVEAHVTANFPQAIRWIESLGFTRETPEPMRGFGPTGEDCYLYARMR